MPAQVLEIQIARAKPSRLKSQPLHVFRIAVRAVPVNGFSMIGQTISHYRIIGKREKSALQGHYQPESVKRFVFGPVEATTYAKWKNVRIEYEIAPKRTTVPGAVRIVIFCKSLDTTMRLTGKRIRKQRLDLASTTLYGYSELASWLESKGFRLVWRAKDAAVGLFLLRRRQ